MTLQITTNCKHISTHTLKTYHPCERECVSLNNYSELSSTRVTLAGFLTSMKAVVYTQGTTACELSSSRITLVGFLISMRAVVST